MSNETLRYLNLIGEHLQEGHASILVGAGFSRNAVKVDERLKNSPDWGELAQIFIDKLASDPQEKDLLKCLSPLVLAERVEAARQKKLCKRRQATVKETEANRGFARAGQRPA